VVVLMFTGRNLLLLPVVLFVRIPTMLPLYILMYVGRYAEWAFDWLNYRLPGLEFKE
jgi:hypothetical protein